MYHYLINTLKIKCKPSPAFALLISLALSLLCFSVTTPAQDNTKYQTSNEQLPTLRIALADVFRLEKDAHDKYSQMNSFLKEYWQIWSIDQNRRVEFTYLSTELAYQALQNNQIDIIAVANNNLENKNILLSIPYAKYRQHIFRRLITDEQNGLQIAIHSINQNNVLPSNASVEQSYFNNTADFIKEIDKFDAITSTRPWVLQTLLTEQNLIDDYYVNTEESIDTYFHFATRSSDRSLLYEINHNLREVNALQAKLWSDKYLLKLPDLTLTLGNYLTNLSEEEKQYVIDHNTLIYPLIQRGFPPYIIPQEFGNISERGLTIDITKLATEKTGLVFKPLYIDNIADGLTRLETGQADVAILARKRGTLEHTFSFSMPYLTSRYNLIHRLDQQSITDFKDLNNQAIAAVIGKYTTEILLKRLPQARITLYASSQDAILAVAKGQADIFIGSPLNSGYIIKQQQLPNLTSKPIANFPEPETLNFATTKNNTALMTLLNRTVNTINPNQFDDIYARWSKTAFNQVYDKEQVATAYRNMSFVLAATIITCLVIFWIYYRQLQVRKAAQHKVEQALKIAEAARLEAEKSAQAKVVFLARMSHEIRTPMNGVLGMAESLAFTELNDNQQDLLDTLKISARNLLALLNDVLDFSKMDAGKLTLESVPVNISTLTRNIIAGFKHLHVESPLQKLNQIDIKLNVDQRITHQYFSDPTRLTQVLNNLLSNAIKFTEHGTITVTIDLASTSQEDNNVFDTLHISVQDSGIGIAKSKQDQLFTPFIQADTDITRKYGGTGLGLSICQEIVRSMGSEILLESTEHQGSLFHFYLKLKQANPVINITERRRSDRQTNAPEDQRFKQFRVLVAEDNSVNLLVITAQLARLNITADVAENGEQALQMYRKNPYDIIISDCHMPIIDGFELARTLTKEKTKPLWLIAMTAEALSGAAEKCFQAGFDDYIAKPCPQEEVTNKLNNAYRQLTHVIT